MKKISLYKMSYFPEPCIHGKNKIEVEKDLSNYATKSDQFNATGVLIHQVLPKRLIQLA